MDKNLNFELYRKLYLIRKCEELIVQYYPEDGMKTPMHMSMGDEAIATGVCHALGNDGQILSAYRSHSSFIARTDDTDEFFAEMYAKDTAQLKGKCGSMHLCYPSKGFLGASAIVASQIPVAVGAAFANKYQNNSKIVAVFFGDGAVDEGVFWESVNAASVMKIPVIFVCEDNGYAVHSKISDRRGYDSITKLVSHYNCQVFESDSTDVEVIYDLTIQAVQAIRKESKPCFMNLKYCRYLQHVGIKTDFEFGYRSKKEFDEWYTRDPVQLQKKKLLSAKVKACEIEHIERYMDEKAARSILAAKEAMLSSSEEACKGVFK